MRDLISPSVYSVSRLRSGTGRSTGSYGITPVPSGAPVGTSRNETVPSGPVSSGGGCPALAMRKVLPQGS
ncbi:hypothetical protein SVIOM342S_06646 [Streptomyces violaceorubidus]